MESEPESQRGLRAVATVDELREAPRRIIDLGSRRLVLVSVAGRLYCVENRCPHAGGSLGEGTLTGHQLVCPRHGWCFDIRTGRCDSDPRYAVETFPVVIDGGTVFVEIGDQ